MDLKGSLINTRLRIYPAKTFVDFLKTLPDEEHVPVNILKLIGRDCKGALNEETIMSKAAQLTQEDLKKLKKIKEVVKEKIGDLATDEPAEIDRAKDSKLTENEMEKCGDTPEKKADKSSSDKEKTQDPVDEEKTDQGETDSNTDEIPSKDTEPFLTTSDIDWLYSYLQKKKSKGDDVPYLHTLLEGANVEVPENKTVKRNPILEARCVRLRSQQEAREYRKMTKTVDNVRLRFPEDSIAYQMKQLNRQLIAIGQFIISIFAGFLFGFRGVELMVGNLEFGFRLLLGVMCALVIALAEIYFLAKKLNEELNIPETVQLGGPPKFADEAKYMHNVSNKAVEKEHQD